MSKQSEAKSRQGYVPKAPTCSTCIHFTSDVVKKLSGWGVEWTEEANLRCAIGGFAVKKMATCYKWSQKP